MTDPACDSLGIPLHLHSLERAVEPMEAGEPVYRFFRKEVDEDLTLAISFNYQRSSVNRAKFSQADDVLWDDVRGGRREGYGVVRFSGDVFEGQVWPVDNGTADYRLTIQHEPRRCNHAHCSIIAYKGDDRVEDIKPPSVKLKIRKWLEGKVFFEVPMERSGQIMPLKAAG